MDYLTSSWQFLKRHKGKLASGATVIGGIYAAKKVVESELFTDLVDRVEKAAGFSVYESPSCNSALEEVGFSLFGHLCKKQLFTVETTFHI
jgi:hypothetical protein